MPDLSILYSPTPYHIIRSACPLLLLTALSSFKGAHSDTLSSLAQRRASAIPRDRFEYDKDGLCIIVLGYKGIIMTWEQLSWVLVGMYDFMTGTPGHYQSLACDIVFIGHGRVGFASILYNLSSLEVTERAPLNTTISLPLVTNIPGPFPSRVPDTPSDTLECPSHGASSTTPSGLLWMRSARPAGNTVLIQSLATTSFEL